MVNRKRHGLALIDVIIGSAMLSIGLGVVISMSTRSLIQQADAEKRITASWLADELLAMALVVGPDEYAKTYPDQGQFDAPFDKFSYEIELDDQSFYLPVAAKASVFWKVSGTEHAVVLETVIARRHGELVDREPVDAVDREARYWEEIEERESQ